jgi:hypothetical protein
MGENLIKPDFNPSNAELNPICNLLALLRAHPILHISRVRVTTVRDGAGYNRLLLAIAPEGRRGAF